MDHQVKWTKSKNGLKERQEYPVISEKCKTGQQFLPRRWNNDPFGPSIPPYMHAHTLSLSCLQSAVFLIYRAVLKQLVKQWHPFTPAPPAEHSEPAITPLLHTVVVSHWNSTKSCHIEHTCACMLPTDGHTPRGLLRGQRAVKVNWMVWPTSVTYTSHRSHICIFDWLTVTLIVHRTLALFPDWMILCGFLIC